MKCFSTCGIGLLLAGALSCAAVAQIGGASGQFDSNISLNIEGEDIAEAMRLFADATGFSILVSKKATGKISAYINDMAPERALKEIVEVNGFRFVKKDRVVWVLTEDEFFEDLDLGRQRRVLPLLHAKAADVAAVVQNALSKSGSVISYPKANSLFVTERSERIERIEELVARLDKPCATRVFQLQHAPATDILDLLREHLGDDAALQADFRTNQIIVADTIPRLESIQDLLREFDVPDRVSTRAFPLKYAPANDVARLLREILSGRKSSEDALSSTSSMRPEEKTQYPTAPPTSPDAAEHEAKQESTKPGPPSPEIESEAEDVPGLGPLANVAADVRSNAVIITHTTAVLERLARIIEEIDVPSEFYFYQFQNVNPAELDLETKLVGLLPAEGGYLNVDPVSKKVAFRSSPEQAREIFALLAQWDDVIRQVRIEAEILSVNASLIKRLGISWQAVIQDIDHGFLSPSETRPVDAQVNFPAPIGAGSPQGILSVGEIESDDYTATLQALASDSDTEVIASPRILARDGQSAIFRSARDEPFKEVTVDGNTQTTLENVRFLNVGTSLIVTPVISKNDVIVIEVQLEISDLAEIRDGIPVVDRSAAQSTVAVRDRGTLVLGGLRQRSRTTVVQGVPGLRKIPLLGGLFRNKRKDKAESEIILVLRPYIVREDHDEIPTSAGLREEIGSAMSEGALHGK